MAGNTELNLSHLRALHAAAKLPDTISIRSATIRLHPDGPDLCSADDHEASIAAIHNAFPALADRMEAAERDRDELREVIKREHEAAQKRREAGE